jgi:predicted 3-demethylubiquinone-9 3-methyltransferase (glyoxalase superfamily)
MATAVKSVRPFLMFQGNCREAVETYVALLPESRIVETRYFGGEPGAEGSVLHLTFELAGQQVLCIDSPVRHSFGFTPSFSFFVECETEAELDRLVSGLGKDGQMLMEPGDHGFGRKFCWLQDRFGISWQINYS